jgi:hypothetical protein
MSIHDCCGTTCDKQAVLAELTELRTFKARVLQILKQADADRHPVGSITGGLLSEVLNEGAPVAITRFRNVDAYLLPERLVREVLKDGH